MEQPLLPIQDLLATPLGQKGMDLWERGLVNDFSCRNENYFSATVDGESVHLSIHQGKLGTHSCSCLDHKHYPGPCPHVIALLLKIEEQQENKGGVDAFFLD